MDQLRVQEIDNRLTFSVKIIPGASRTALAGLLNDMLKIKLTAPPQKGKANRQLIELLAAVLELNKQAIQITAGRTSPIKQITLTGLTKEQLLQKLNLATRDRQ